MYRINKPGTRILMPVAVRDLRCRHLAAAQVLRKQALPVVTPDLVQGVEYK